MDAPRIVFVIYDGVQSLDLTGPLEAFVTASRFLKHEGRGGGYQVRVASVRPGPVTTSSGLTIMADTSLTHIRELDTLVVAGGAGVDDALADARLVRGISRLAARARRVTSVCTGALLLAEAGLLAGRRVTTHWLACESLGARYPELKVEEDRIFVRDGRVTTSAGVTAGIDLALALIEEDYGRAVALMTARLLVVYLKRPGGQTQFSAPLEAQGRARPPLADFVAWIRENAAGDLSVAALARRAGMSRRHFVRVFTREVGTPPARFVTRMRVEAARDRLEDDRSSLDEVASACGFGSAEVMRRVFQRALGVAPHDYRQRFAGGA